MNAPGFFRSISLFISVTVFPGCRDGFRGFTIFARRTFHIEELTIAPVLLRNTTGIFVSSPKMRNRI